MTRNYLRIVTEFTKDLEVADFLSGEGERPMKRLHDPGASNRVIVMGSGRE
jgi:hypothetical protein